MERKQKKTKGIILALLVGVSLFLLIGVAAVLYGKLSSGYETDRLAVYEESEGSKKEEDITGETEEEKVEDTTEETEKVEDTMEETEKEKVEDRENSTEETTSSSKETTSENQQETQEDKAPDFEVYDKEGNPVRLEDFRGKPVVLNFWASWCGPCRSEMPDFQTSYEKYGEEIHFLMVNLTDGVSETVEDASKFIQDSGYSFPVYFDSQQEAAIKYGIISIPSTFFIGADGTVIANGQGALDGATLQKGIDMIYP